ncbi:MAG: manganese efflux pump MntP family protein [Hyphomicrobiales bacterium]|nr:manganese efflux pump MntP family protein [Hyphomicrobiales bacterium]
MTLLSLFVLAFGLSIDAFAAALGRGAANGAPSTGAVLKGAFVFGFTEMLTPIIGWAIGWTFAGWVEAIDHWIAFGLLMAVGLHMAWHAWRREEDEEPPRRGLVGLIVTAFGTSIDAMAVGVSLALLDVDILVAAPIIGATTFVMTAIGLSLGRRIGETVGHRAEIAAGFGLALIGCGILWAHTMA